MFLINIVQQTKWGETDCRRDKVVLPTKKLKPGNGGDFEKSRRRMGGRRGGTFYPSELQQCIRDCICIEFITPC